MIFHKLQAIFIHTERTGGVSIRKHLLNYEIDFKRIGETKHYTAKETKERVGEDVWNKYFKFGFIRNPYDRLLSWYLACKKNDSWAGNELADYIRQFDTFEEMVMADVHPLVFVPQYKKVEGLDFVGRYENYETDVKKICFYLNIPHINIKENATSHKHYREYYNYKMKKRVKSLFKNDLERFKYEF